jgi:hypothetical protein
MEIYFRLLFFDFSHFVLVDDGVFRSRPTKKKMKTSEDASEGVEGEGGIGKGLIEGGGFGNNFGLTTA